MKTTLSIVGARPQFVKLAVVAQALAEHGDLRHVCIHTGQHFDENMSRVFFQDMQIAPPEYNLGINSCSHGMMTGRMLEQIESILIQERPDLVLVYGDTNSTLAGALAAKKLQIPIAHVEAGLRSYDLSMPEEINRTLTDRISDLLFCPTDKAVANLKREGFESLGCRIIKSGDVMFDACLRFGEVAASKSKILEQLELPDVEFALCTLHRAANTDNGMRLTAIVSGLNEIADKLPVVMPIHPRTRAAIKRTGIDARFETIEPVGYLDMLRLLGACSFVITDSGGLQKEAFFHRKQCFTLRDATEWPELVEQKVNVLVDCRPDSYVLEYMNRHDLTPDFDFKPYGDGRAAEKIAVDIADFLALQS